MENKNFSMLDAKKILESEYSDLRVKNGVDYDKHYVFSTEPKNHNEVRDGRWLNGLLAVDKKTQKVIGFNPFSFDIDAYFKAADENMVSFDTESKKLNQHQLRDKGEAYVNKLFNNRR